MSLELIATGFVMGLAGAGHCALMCGSACTAMGLGARPESVAPAGLGAPGSRHLRVLRLEPALALAAGAAPLPGSNGRSLRSGLPGAAIWAFLASRVLSYAVGGAVVAASVAALGALGQAFSLLRPFWLLLQVGVLALGLWLLATGRQPAALMSWAEGLGGRRSSGLGAGRFGWRASGAARSPMARAVVAGGAWVLLPCGLLQSALVAAALASTPLSGAGVMAAFALASSLGLLGAPAVVGLLRRWGAAGEQAVTRVAGAMLAASAAWALWMLSTESLMRALCAT